MSVFATTLQRIFALSFVVGVSIGLSGCIGSPTTRLGMVKNKDTGIMIGSRIEKSIVTDPSFYKNKKIKVRLRNTSGDTAFDLYGFKSKLQRAYAATGFEPTDGDDFGLLVDVNVMYSGQIQHNLATEYGFLGGAAGGIGGYRSNATAGTAIGAVAGATIGSIIGSYVTDDTYIIIANVAFAQVKERTQKEPAKTIVFSRSPTSKNEDDEADKPARSLRKATFTHVAVFAGGRNVSQDEIAGMVRTRIIRIVGDFL